MSDECSVVFQGAIESSLEVMHKLRNSLRVKLRHLSLGLKRVMAFLWTRRNQKDVTHMHPFWEVDVFDHACG